MSDEPDFYDVEEDENVNNSMEENFKPDISKIKKKKKKKTILM